MDVGEEAEEELGVQIAGERTSPARASMRPSAGQTKIAVPHENGDRLKKRGNGDSRQTHCIPGRPRRIGEKVDVGDIQRRCRRTSEPKNANTSANDRMKLARWVCCAEMRGNAKDEPCRHVRFDERAQAEAAKEDIPELDQVSLGAGCLLDQQDVGPFGGAEEHAHVPSVARRCIQAARVTTKQADRVPAAKHECPADSVCNLR